MDFATLYRSYSRDVHRFALYLGGDLALADDITQETFVRVWTARERRDIASVKGYLLAIARNLYLHGRREAARREPLAEDGSEPRTGRADDPAASAETRAELQAVLAALGELPEVDRAALLLRAEQDLPYEEIAALLSISVAAARVKVHRARVALGRSRAAARFTAPTKGA